MNAQGAAVDFGTQARAVERPIAVMVSISLGSLLRATELVQRMTLGMDGLVGPNWREHNGVEARRLLEEAVQSVLVLPGRGVWHDLPEGLQELAASVIRAAGGEPRRPSESVSFGFRCSAGGRRFHVRVTCVVVDGSADARLVTSQGLNVVQRRAAERMLAVHLFGRGLQLLRHAFAVEEVRHRRRELDASPTNEVGTRRRP